MINSSITYDPSWKISGSFNLSTLGRKEVVAAIKRGDRTGAISAMFRISRSAVAYWRKRS